MATTKPRICQDKESVAELTKLGWFVMSPGTEFCHTRILLTQSPQADYEQLWRLDILGMEDSSENDQDTVYSEFKEQLKHGEHGWYESGLPRKGNHFFLLNRKRGTL